MGTFKRRFTPHLLLKFRDQNLFCFDVITRDIVDDYELTIGQIFINSVTSSYNVRGNRKDFPITDDETTKKLVEYAKEIILSYEDLRKEK